MQPDRPGETLAGLFFCWKEQKDVDGQRAPCDSRAHPRPHDPMSHQPSSFNFARHAREANASLRAESARRGKRRAAFDGPRHIEIEEMEAGLAAGTLKEYSRGDENVYFTRADGRKVYCKCL